MSAHAVARPDFAILSSATCIFIPPYLRKRGLLRTIPVLPFQLCTSCGCVAYALLPLLSKSPKFTCQGLTNLSRFLEVVNTVRTSAGFLKSGRFAFGLSRFVGVIIPKGIYIVNTKR